MMIRVDERLMELLRMRGVNVTWELLVDADAHREFERAIEVQLVLGHCEVSCEKGFPAAAGSC